MYLRGTGKHSESWSLCSQTFCCTTVSRNPASQALLFSESPSEVRKLAVIWKEVLYQLGFRRAWKGTHRWLFPDRPLRLALHIQRVSFSTHSLCLPLPVSTLCRSLEPFLPREKCPVDAGPCREDQERATWATLPKTNGRKMAAPSLSSTAKPCADKNQYPEKSRIYVQIKYKSKIHHFPNEVLSQSSLFLGAQAPLPDPDLPQ